MAENDFKQNMTWEERAKKNPLYAVMTANDVFVNKTGDVTNWSQKDLDILRNKGKLIFNIYIYPILIRSGYEPSKTLIVEYGSGLGTILDAAHKLGYSCAGIDISPTMLSYSRIVSPTIESLYCLDKNNTTNLPDKCADVVFTRAVLQHIRKLSDMRKAIKEMCRLLKSGGILKLHFHSTDILPFEHTAGFTFNFEWFSVSTSRSFLIRHTNWSGVPLTINNLDRYLLENGVVLFGLERDIVNGKSFIWATAKKK